MEVATMEIVVSMTMTIQITDFIRFSFHYNTPRLYLSYIFVMFFLAGCADQESASECTYLKNEGICNTHDFMKEICKKTCGFCSK